MVLGIITSVSIVLVILIANKTEVKVNKVIYDNDDI